MEGFRNDGLIIHCSLNANLLFALRTLTPWVYSLPDQLGEESGLQPVLSDRAKLNNQSE